MIEEYNEETETVNEDYSEEDIEGELRMVALLEEENLAVSLSLFLFNDEEWGDELISRYKGCP